MIVLHEDRFYMDPETDAPHVRNHDVDEDEVADVLLNPGEDRVGREGSRVAVGRTRGGRYLRVIYVPDPEPASVFVSPHTSWRARRYWPTVGVGSERASDETVQVPGGLG